MPAAQRSLTIVIPGLAGAAPRDGLALAALDTAVARGDRVAAEPAPPEALLFRLFGHRRGDADLPVAAVTRAADMDGAAGGWWLRADPVHLRPDRDTLFFVGPVADLSVAEAGQLVGELDPVFLPRGWHLYMGHPARWYLRLPEDPQMRTCMPSEVAGRDVRGLLPFGPHGALWHVLMNEVQMQLHMSEVNRQRQARGAAEVNSLWFWGGGPAPRMTGGWTAMWCDDVLGCALARAAGTPRLPLPPAAGAWLEDAGPGTHALVITAPWAALSAGDTAAWRAALQAFNDDWVAPLTAALRRRAVARIDLMSGGAHDLRLTAWGLRRWWRRRAGL